MANDRNSYGTPRPAAAEAAAGLVVEGAPNGIQSAIDAGIAMGFNLPREVPKAKSYAVIPKDAKLEILERPDEPPSRIKSVAAFTEAVSFCRYLSDFNAGTTKLFGDRKAGTFRAILDYHTGPAAPAWGSHQALLQLRVTEPWQRWVGQNGKRMDQVTFATFLEDNLPDIATPPGAVLLETARAFEIKRNVAFSSAIRLTDGQHQLEYREDLEGTSQKGTMTVPDRFTLGIAPYEGVEPYRIDARLRYRLQDGKLALWYDLFRVEDTLRAAFEEVVVFVRAQTSLETLHGTVEMKETPAR